MAGHHRRIREITRTTELLCITAAGLLLAWFVIPLLLDILKVGHP